MNGKLIQNHDATVISFMSLLVGVFYLSLFFIKINLPQISLFCFNNWALMLILASICICFYGSVKVMKKLSPYTVMLTTNLEHIYAILLLVERKNEFLLYVGAVIIIITVI
jgi:drug/metabolite transporter (DMT)-like permease